MLIELAGRQIDKRKQRRKEAAVAAQECAPTDPKSHPTGSSPKKEGGS
ncbi:MAG: hypothetical protein QOH66_969 [Actinomycetota bacterium]|nr:hypothetical protein [Actinomycetota bacterium]